MTKQLTLQGCYANQFATDGVKTDWNIISADQEPLGEFPKCLNESQFFHIIDFARKYEKLAHTRGKEEEEVRARAYINEMKKRYEAMMGEMRAENERIAGILETLIGEGE